MRPIGESEKAIMYRLVDDLPHDSLTIFDRGFPSFALMFRMINQEIPRHFLMRCKRGFNKEVKDFLKRGANHGNDFGDWLEAERIVQAKVKAEEKK